MIRPSGPHSLLLFPDAYDRDDESIERGTGEREVCVCQRCGYEGRALTFRFHTCNHGKDAVPHGLAQLREVAPSQPASGSPAARGHLPTSRRAA